MRLAIMDRGVAKYSCFIGHFFVKFVCLYVTLDTV